VLWCGNGGRKKKANTAAKHVMAPRRRRSSSSDVVGDHEPSHASEDLVPAVPGADEEKAAGEHACFEDADEYAGCEETAEAGSEAGKGDGHYGGIGQ
jgi:hypothetical protein